MLADYYKIDMEVSGCDICIVEKYHGHRSKVKVKVTEIMKNT